MTLSQHLAKKHGGESLPPDKKRQDKLTAKISDLNARLLNNNTTNFKERRALITDGYFISKIAFDYANELTENYIELRKCFFAQFTAINKEINNYCQKSPEFIETKHENHLELKFYEIRSKLFSIELYPTHNDQFTDSISAIAQANKTTQEIYQAIKNLPEDNETRAIIDTAAINMNIKILELEAIVKFNNACELLDQNYSEEKSATQAITDAFKLLNSAEQIYSKLQKLESSSLYDNKLDVIMAFSLNFPNKLLQLGSKNIFPSLTVLNLAFDQLIRVQTYYHRLTDFEEAVEAQGTLEKVKKIVMAKQNSTLKVLRKIPIDNNANNTNLSLKKEAIDITVKRKHEEIFVIDNSQDNNNNNNQTELSPRKKQA